MVKIFIAPSQTTRTSIGVLGLRLVAGIALVVHGWSKITDPFGWVDKMVPPAPELLQTLAPLAAVGEFIGGILLAVGLMGPVAALLVMGAMAGAVFYHWEAGHAFVAVGQPSWESAAVYLAVGFVLLCTGPGAFSLDKVLFSKK